MADDKLHAEALEAYEEALGDTATTKNRDAYLEDYRFWRMEEQWPEDIVKLRSTPGKERPMLTINRGPSFANQVINDIRQNRPQIKVRPVDSGADIQTATVIGGIIRNIEVSSNAAVSYDWAAECAVYGGFGYYKIDYDYACDDSFDMDIMVKRITNPLSIVADPYSQAVDSSDWNFAFEVELLSENQFERDYPDADPVSFDSLSADVRKHWTDGNDILVAAYWKRAEVEKIVYRMSDRTVIGRDEYLAPGIGGEPSAKEIMDAAGVTVVAERSIKSYKVKKCIMNGQEILNEKTYDWPGKYIPIIPVYGVEINDQGERLFRSMMHSAKDPQRQLNYWETTATELVALAPRVPFVGEQGSFSVDPNWQTAHIENHAFLEYKKGLQKPERMSVDSGPALGAMTQAKQAGDNLKSVLGMYDASLGNRSNETSGIAIERRQREGDTGQFHFSDNLMRAIRHGGLVIMDLIPHVYTKDRIVRVLGEDGAAQNIQLGQRQYPEQTEQRDPPPPRIGALEGVFDIAMGKYDLTVEAGPSYTTQRQETAEVVGKLMQAYPPLVEIGGDILVKNLDLKDGDELARRLGKMLPPQLQDNGDEQIPPQVQQMIEQGKQIIAELTEENQKLKAAEAKIGLEQSKIGLEQAKIPVMQLEKQIDLLTAQKELLTAQANLEKVRAEIDVAKVEIAGQIANGENEQVNSVAPAIMQTMEALRAEVQRPKRKTAVMRRQSDGSYLAEMLEQADAPMVQ